MTCFELGPASNRSRSLQCSGKQHKQQLSARRLTAISATHPFTTSDIARGDGYSICGRESYPHLGEGARSSHDGWNEPVNDGRDDQVNDADGDSADLAQDHEADKRDLSVPNDELRRYRLARINESLASLQTFKYFIGVVVRIATPD